MATNRYFEYFLKNEKNTVLMNNTWTIWNNRNFGEIECRKLFSKSQSGCRRPSDIERVDGSVHMLVRIHIAECIASDPITEGHESH